MKTTLNLFAALLMLLGMAFTSAAEKYEPPKTAFGVPDVQGIWTYETRTSLQRPEIYEGALEIDEETMLAKMISTQEYNKFLAETGAEGPTGGAVGAYNDFWFAPGNALAIMNGMYRTSLIIDPANGQIPWKEGGQEIRQAQRDRLLMGRDRSDGPEGRGLADRCLVSYASTMPFVSSFYNNNMQIVQSPTHVMLLAEMVHNVRVVLIDQDFRDLPFEQWLEILSATMRTIPWLLSQGILIPGKLRSI